MPSISKCIGIACDFSRYRIIFHSLVYTPPNNFGSKHGSAELSQAETVCVGGKLANDASTQSPSSGGCQRQFVHTCSNPCVLPVMMSPRSCRARGRGAVKQRALGTEHTERGAIGARQGSIGAKEGAIDAKEGSHLVVAQRREIGRVS